MVPLAQNHTYWEHKFFDNTSETLGHIWPLPPPSLLLNTSRRNRKWMEGCGGGNHEANLWRWNPWECGHTQLWCIKQSNKYYFSYFTKFFCKLSKAGTILYDSCPFKNKISKFLRASGYYGLKHFVLLERGRFAVNTTLINCWKS